MSHIKVGLQMYSLRDACAKDFYGCIRAAAAAGYAGVEFAGFFDKPAQEVRKVVEDCGLSVYGAHVGYELLLPDKIKQTMDYHAELGNRRLVIPYIWDPYRENPEACRKTAGILATMVQTLRDRFMETGYHTHEGDVLPMQDGDKATTAYDLLLSLTPPDFIMQLDVGNMVKAGVDPGVFFLRYPGRAKQLHLKEYGRGSFKLPMGAGDVPWAQVFRYAETTAGTDQYIVEVESYWDDPLECVIQDRSLLRNMGV